MDVFWDTVYICSYTYLLTYTPYSLVFVPTLSVHQFQLAAVYQQKRIWIARVGTYHHTHCSEAIYSNSNARKCNFFFNNGKVHFVDEPKQYNI